MLTVACCAVKVERYYGKTFRLNLGHGIYERRRKERNVMSGAVSLC